MSIPAVLAAESEVKGIVDLLRACFETALGRPVCHRPGAIVELLISTSGDECCEGAAWVRGGSITPATDEAGNCLPDQFSLQVELGASRCYPTPDEQSIPTCEQNTAVAEEVLSDWAAMLCAVHCFLRVDNRHRVSLGVWDQAPVEGGCAGSRMLATVSFSPCLTCPSE